MNIKKLVELFKTLPKGQLQEIYEKSRDLLHLPLQQLNYQKIIWSRSLPTE